VRTKEVEPGSSKRSTSATIDAMVVTPDQA
jgi:hypothetical protein